MPFTPQKIKKTIKKHKRDTVIFLYHVSKRNKDAKKLNLYGEKDEDGIIKIYGITNNEKNERKYFSEEDFLGTLCQIDGRQYICMNKEKEILLEGFYIFYDKNEKMQEYLIDHYKEEKQEEAIHTKGLLWTHHPTAEDLTERCGS